MDCVILIPVLNPEREFQKYLTELINNKFQYIIVVNDGSDPEYEPVFDDVKKQGACVLLTHEINKGKGQAIKTGLNYYQNHKELCYQDSCGIITVDADGQHRIEDVIKIANVLKNTETVPSLIIGERQFGKDVPLRSRLGNILTGKLFRVLYKSKVQDTQTGLRGIPNQLIPMISKIEGQRYEYEMNMLIFAAKEQIPVTQIPIETVYLNKNESSHFHPIKDSFKIYRLLLGTFLRYSVSSIVSAGLDICLFALFVYLSRNMFVNNYIIISTAAARIISALFNFLVNKNLVFQSSGRTGKKGVQYACLCIVQMLCSAYLTRGIFILIPIKEWMIKIVVDTILFFFSYTVQKKLIFKR